MKIEDVIALLSVQNTHLDYDAIELIYLGKKMAREKTLDDYHIKNDDTVMIDNKARDNGCCIIV